MATAHAQLLLSIKSRGKFREQTQSALTGAMRISARKAC